jgi:hypothetical protein
LSTARERLVARRVAVEPIETVTTSPEAGQIRRPSLSPPTGSRSSAVGRDRSDDRLHGHQHQRARAGVPGHRRHADSQTERCAGRDAWASATSPWRSDRPGRRVRRLPCHDRGPTAARCGHRPPPEGWSSAPTATRSAVDTARATPGSTPAIAPLSQAGRPAPRLSRPHRDNQELPVSLPRQHGPLP